MFTPQLVSIIDNSAKHIGHTQKLGITHLELTIVSSFFTGMNRLERQRAIHSALKKEFRELHSISMKLYDPMEYSKWLD